MKNFNLKLFFLISLAVSLKAKKTKIKMESFQKESVVSDVLDYDPTHLLNVL